jgi:hypothetical protein
MTAAEPWGLESARLISLRIPPRDSCTVTIVSAIWSGGLSRIRSRRSWKLRRLSRKLLHALVSRTNKCRPYSCSARRSRRLAASRLRSTALRYCSQISPSYFPACSASGLSPPDGIAALSVLRGIRLSDLLLVESVPGITRCPPSLGHCNPLPGCCQTSTRCGNDSVLRHSAAGPAIIDLIAGLTFVLLPYFSISGRRRTAIEPPRREDARRGLSLGRRIECFQGPWDHCTVTVHIWDG